jgi:exopolyphosphatase/guanosine-5'-triphosphate,3'-diphosphate pyrophosphatase
MIEIGTAIFNYKEVHLHELSLNSISELVKVFSGKTVQERKKTVGLHPQRADVILAGALIIEVILKNLSLSSCLISVRDLLFGVLIKGSG